MALALTLTLTGCTTPPTIYGTSNTTSTTSQTDLYYSPTSMDNTSKANKYSSAPAQLSAEELGRSQTAVIKTNKGDITLKLYTDAAPLTVSNFAFLAKENFYDGLTFHRYEPGFVIQGGDPLGTGTGGPGYTVPAEIGKPHIKGAIAMARQGDSVNPTRASSGSQFYITLDVTDFLDGAYTVFGEVTSGMDVVEQLRKGDTIIDVTVSAPAQGSIIPLNSDLQKAA